MRKRCGDDPVLCYKEMEWAGSYLNRTKVKVALGIPGGYDYACGCKYILKILMTEYMRCLGVSWDINAAFI